MDIRELTKLFFTHYGEKEGEAFVFFAPGRVNLIGEHTDYNNGYVLPCALSFGTYLVVRKIREKVLYFRSENFPDSFSIPVEQLREKRAGEWVNYPLGVIDQLMKQGLAFNTGLQLLYSGNIPPAAGLSSSASIELVTGVALDEIFSLGIDRVEMIRLCRRAENEFVGVNCGIMDQFIVGKARKSSALFLNCGTLQYVHVPFVLHDHRLIIINSNKERKLADSKYNERVKECQAAVDAFQQVRRLGSLGELSLETFREQCFVIKDPVVLKRARHVVSENRRVLEAVKALMNKQLETFGQLMIESHHSLRDDYEVTGPELDALVEAALSVEGTVGARMTGAGFGGCTVNIVRNDAVERFMDTVRDEYFGKTGLKAEFYLPEIDGGARKLGPA